jgi:hypothetical protein
LRFILGFILGFILAMWVANVGFFLAFRLLDEIDVDELAMERVVDCAKAEMERVGAKDGNGE